jgi:hypothetical protein
MVETTDNLGADESAAADARRARFAAAVALLDPNEEVALAEESIADALEVWPEY